MKRTLIIHPFLFALFPSLYLFARNADEISPGELILPVIVALVGALVLFSSLCLITRSGAKSGIISTFFIVLFYSYGGVRDLLVSVAKAHGRFYSVSFYLGCFWAVLVIALVFLIIKLKNNFLTFTRFLNVASITLIVISLASVTVYFVRGEATLKDATNPEGQTGHLGASQNLPDIYYIILDEYGRESTLREVYGYDNSEFIKSLTARGFSIIVKSRSNYDTTYPSLASSLNMQYLKEELGGNNAALLNMIGDSEVLRFLRARGYRLIHVPSSWDFKGISKYMEVIPQGKIIFGSRASSLSYYLVQSTALAPFASFFSDHGRQAILDAFDTLADIPELKEPTFVFAHVLCPHQPFIFNRDGSPIPMSIFEVEGDVAEKYRKGYIEQLIFINKKIEALVDEILAKSEIAPIIILQGDHGPQPVRSDDEDEQLTQMMNMNERMNILNAYYLPGKDNSVLYPSITPVNSFRLIFNLYFGTDYELLPDRSYYSRDFIEVPPEL